MTKNNIVNKNTQHSAWTNAADNIDAGDMLTILMPNNSCSSTVCIAALSINAGTNNDATVSSTTLPATNN